MKTLCKFYFWLNVGCIINNSELEKITEMRMKNSPKVSLLTDDPSDKEKLVPLHFEEFREFNASNLNTDKKMRDIQYPEYY